MSSSQSSKEGNSKPSTSMSTSAVPGDSLNTSVSVETISSDKFDVDLFEMRLEALKDTQEGIQQMSAWCLQQRANHKRIVASWLNVFKRVRVEHRLTLFYLANDVIQYSKRRRYEFVESWATAIQKATTMVRDDRVKNKILRIFNIWGQREIYNEEYLSDLCGLLNIAPQKKTALSIATDSDEYQNANLIANIRECVQLSETTDKSFKKLPKSPNCDIDLIKQQLKDKNQSVDIEKELERYITYIEVFNKNLQTEIKSRKTVISQLDKAIKFYSNQLSEVKVVVSAYKNFGSRIKLVKKKVEEVSPNLPSPLPSPDINAPSPEPDADIQLPDDNSTHSMNQPKNVFNGYSYLGSNVVYGRNDFKPIEDTNANTNRSIEVINSRLDPKTFVGSTDFYKHESIDTISAYSGTNNVEIPGLSSIPVPTIPSGGYTSLARSSQQYSDVLQSSQNQSLYAIPGSNINNNNVLTNNDPDSDYANSLGACRNFSNNSNYDSNIYENSQSGRVKETQSSPTIQPLLPPLPPAPVMNIETSGSSWNLNMNWANSLNSSNTGTNCYGNDIIARSTSHDTSISPSRFESGVQNSKSGNLDYSDHEAARINSVENAEHRHLRLQSTFGCGTKLLLSKEKIRQLDIDHRNLISLTGSPRSNDNENKKWKSSIDAETPENIALENNQSPLKGSEKNNSGAQTKRGGMGSDSTDMVVDMDLSDEELDDIYRDKTENKGLGTSPTELKDTGHSLNATTSVTTDSSQHLQTSTLDFLSNDNCINYNPNNPWNTSIQGESLNSSNIAETSTEGAGYSTVSTNSINLNQRHSDWAKVPWNENEERPNDIESMSSMHRLPLPPMQFPYGNINECNNPSFLGNTVNCNRDGSSYGRNSNRGWANVPPNQYRPFLTRPPRGAAGGGNVLHGPPFFNRGGSRLSGHTGIIRANNFRTKMRGKSNWI